MDLLVVVWVSDPSGLVALRTTALVTSQWSNLVYPRPCLFCAGVTLYVHVGKQSCLVYIMVSVTSRSWWDLKLGMYNIYSLRYSHTCTHTHTYIYMCSILANHGRSLDPMTSNGRILPSKELLQYMRQFKRTRKYSSHLQWTQQWTPALRHGLAVWLGRPGEAIFQWNEWLCVGKPVSLE